MWRVSFAKEAEFSPASSTLANRGLQSSRVGPRLCLSSTGLAQGEMKLEEDEESRKCTALLIAAS